jgi:AcrR family transcriptional regulator
MVRAGLTLERLIEAGAGLADEAGFDAVTPSALARHFDVRVASLYSHVGGANALKAGVALYALDRLAGRIALAVAGRAGKEALFALANAHRDFAKAHPGLFAAARYPLDGEAAARSGGARIALATRAVLRGYHLGEPAETHAIRLLGSVFLGFSTLELAGGFKHSRPSSQASWQAGLEALHSMLGALAQEGAPHA